MVALPKHQPARGNRVGRLHLRPEEGGDDFTRQVRPADVHPSVRVHLAAEELAAVGTLLADDLGALG
jgi:hypothetical protein